MVIDKKDILAAFEDLAKIENLRVTITSAAKGGAITGLSTFVGGLLFGYDGMALGGLVGIAAGRAASVKFKPLYQVIQELSEEENKLFVSHMRNILNKLDITDAAVLIAVVRNPEAVGRVVLVKALDSYFKNKSG